ncbi:MAG: biotin--[acetyl-CoA-carboxylase] ligase [Candidatus Dadabacteria bacterium]|nr:MAG: biotin--[acetyl-CoA-carboxylase] ligase [Candidatus Dadabacteria bacterium]
MSHRPESEGTVDQPNWRVCRVDQVSSTMDMARELVREGGGDDPLIVIAKRQTAGRGRDGRSWFESEGGLYLTYALSSPEPEKLQGLSLVVGLAVVEALSLYTAELRLKWPNDIVSVTGKKLGGILIEIYSENGKNTALIGLGLNVRAVPEEVADATALYLLSHTRPDVEQLLRLLSERLWEFWQEFLASGFQSFRNLWLLYDYCSGRIVELECADRKISGRAEGVTEKGALLIAKEDGSIERIISAHILNIL